MTSVWVAEHGWCYLNAIIDCCTREIVGWSLELRCRAAEATAVIKQAVDEQRILPGTLTLGTDNGSAFTARSTRLAISALGVTHRRGGYRDPESQAFIESWFRYLKERCVWRNEFETLDQAREVIAAYIDHYHDRPHSRLDYRHTARGARHVGRCAGSATENRGLNRQRGKGAVHVRVLERMPGLVVVAVLAAAACLPASAAVEQIVATLWEAEKLQAQGLTIPQACKRLGISDQTFYRWRIEFGALKEDEAQRLKALEQENARLKKIVAEQAQRVVDLRGSS